MSHKKVKTLSVDDDGRLVAELEGGTRAVFGFTEASLGQPGGIAQLNRDGKVPPDSLPPTFQKMFSPLPEAGPEWEGLTLNHEHPGEKTELMICIRNSGGGYEWIKIGEST
ncbi:hypothetical protein ES703_103497 [subsurface metagenome]